MISGIPKPDPGTVITLLPGMKPMAVDQTQRGILARPNAFKDFLCSSGWFQFKPSETQRFVDAGQKPTGERRKNNE
jgi:hypothetical protein